MAEAANRT